VNRERVRDSCTIQEEGTPNFPNSSYLGNDSVKEGTSDREK